MTDSSDKREDIVYLYVNNFTYKDDKYLSAMGGHPTTGRIYRAFYDKESELYRILFDDQDSTKYTGLVVKELVNEDPRWSANMEVLDDESILNYDITAEDYSKLAKWKESANSDIESLRLENSDKVSASPVDGVTKLTFSKVKEEVSLEEAGITNYNTLADIDKDVAAGLTLAMAGIISYLDSCSESEPDLGKLLTMSRRHGKGVNCGIAVEALSEYLQNDSYLASGALTKAVYYLLREIARINKEANE